MIYLFYNTWTYFLHIVDWIVFDVVFVFFYSLITLTTLDFLNYIFNSKALDEVIFRAVF